MKNSKITIIRTAVGSPASVELIKELKKRGVRIIGTDSNPLSVGFHFCDKSYIISKGNSPKFLREILKICNIEKPDAITPCLEEEILVLSKNKKLFKKNNILILSPELKTVKICSDKIVTHRFLEKLGVSVPRVYKKNNVRFPIVIKPRFGRGGNNVVKVENKRELNFHLKKIKKPILEEFVNGREYSIDILADLHSNILSIVPRVRIQIESGISIKGKTVRDKKIINYCKKIIKDLRIIGPCCIQCIKDKDGLKFTEINLRFGGGSSLSRKADPTIIPNLIRIIKGEKLIKSKGFKDGLTMLRYYSEVYV